jgi:hypothetical protein
MTANLFIGMYILAEMLDTKKEQKKHKRHLNLDAFFLCIELKLIYG